MNELVEYKQNKLMWIINHIKVTRTAKHLLNFFLQYAQSELQKEKKIKESAGEKYDIDSCSTRFKASIFQINRLSEIHTSNFKHIKNALKELMKTISITDHSIVLPPIVYVNVDINDGIYIFELQKTLATALVDNNYFTQLNLLEFNDLNSKHSIVLYEWLKRYEKAPQIPQLTILEFRKIVHAENKKSYDNLTHLQKKVIDIAVSEINEKTPYFVSYELIKTYTTVQRMKITDIKFTMTQKKNKTVTTPTSTELVEKAISSGTLNQDNIDHKKVRYPLGPTLFAIILSWMCGYNSALQVEYFWRYKFKILKQSIPNFPDSLISHDTVNRLLSLIVVDDLKSIIGHFAELVVNNIGYNELVTHLDRHTPKTDDELGKEYLDHSDDDRFLYQELYYVTLFESTSGLSLRMEEVKKKENENKSCVRAIKLFDLQGTIVTANALNTQRSVVDAIMERGGDYVLALKDNHKSLKKVVQEALNNPELMNEYGQTYVRDVEIAHGIIEQRTVYALPVSTLKNQVPLKEWKKDAQTIFMAVTERVSREPEDRLFISSLSFDNPNIAALGYRAIKEHWHKENNLHWCLDMDFGQDHMQFKNRNYLRNCEILSRIALNAIRLLEPNFRRPGRNESVSLSNVKHCLDWTLDQNIMTVANLFVEGKI